MKNNQFLSPPPSQALGKTTLLVHYYKERCIGWGTRQKPHDSFHS